MNQIAYIFGETTIYWSSILIASAAFCSLLMVFAIRLWRNEPLLPVFVFLSTFYGLSVSRFLSVQ